MVTISKIDGYEFTFDKIDGVTFSNLIKIDGFDIQFQTTGQNGVFAGGSIDFGATVYNTIDRITISTTGDAADFGDLTLAKSVANGGTSNGTNNRGVFAGGFTPSPASYHNTIEYITISSPSNATDFGDLTEAKDSIGSCSNGTNNRGVFACGFISGASLSNTIEYITISTTGDATNFGDTGTETYAIAGTSNGTNNRGIFFSVGTPGIGNVNTIEYITITNTTNSTDFGDMINEVGAVAACSNTTNDRGIVAGGYDFGTSLPVNTIQYITISSTGNATSFGDLTIARCFFAGTSNGINNRGVFAGGDDEQGPSPTEYDTIDYITITSTGNATDFGNLTVTRASLAGCSDAD